MIKRCLDLSILFYWPGQEIDAREHYQTLSEFRIQQYLTDMSKQNMKYQWIEVTVLVMHDHESEGCQVYPWTMPPRKHCGGKKLADVWSSWPTAAWSRVWWWTWCHTGQSWFLEFVVKHILQAGAIFTFLGIKYKIHLPVKSSVFISLLQAIVSISYPYILILVVRLSVRCPLTPKSFIFAFAFAFAFAFLSPSYL